MVDKAPRVRKGARAPRPSSGAGPVPLNDAKAERENLPGGQDVDMQDGAAESSFTSEAQGMNNSFDMSMQASASGSAPDAGRASNVSTRSNEEIIAFRARLVDSRQAELARIVDGHDNRVRELFHLDRFVTMTDFDPVVAKADKSDVFLSFQHDYDLYTNAAVDSSSGPARRQTRRALTDRKGTAIHLPEPTAAPVAPIKPTASKRRVSDVKGKGKAKAVAVAEPVAKKGARKSLGDGATPVARAKGVKRVSNATAAAPSTPVSTPTSSTPLSKRAKYAHGAVVPFTHPSQIPAAPTYGSSLATYLASYLDADDDPAASTDPAALEAKAEHEAAILSRVADFRAQGGHLYNPNRRITKESKRAVDHGDYLVEHAVHFSKLINDEKKAHLLMAKRVGRMVLQHFDRQKGQEERELKELQRGQKALAKWTVREVGKKWKMAVNVVKAQRKDLLKQEQDRVGKIQLNAMLDKSTTILQAQQVEMAGDSDEADTSSAASSSSDEEGEEEEESEAEDDEEDEDDEENAEQADDVMVTKPARASSTRSRTALVAPSPPADDSEPMGEDFEAPEDILRAQEDETWEQEMNNQVEEDSGDEMDGLAADAEMSIEELMRISGYPPPEAESPLATEPGDDVDEEEEEEGQQEDEDEETRLDVDDVEFGSTGDAAREDEDAQFAQDMDAEEGESDDSEMDGLAEDADLPIEELMKKYGRANGQEDESAATSDAPVESEAEEEEDEVEVDLAEAGVEEELVEDMGVVTPERVHLRPPFLLRGSLRPYQQAGLEWLAGLYATGVNGILADEMGLGKTIQTISLLAHLACDRGQWGPHLVVVPTSVMLNWEMEFKKFLPGFKILTYYGSIKERKEKRRGWNAENSFNVCVTSYQLVLADQQAFRRKPWQYMILDEAHHIKNFRSQRWQTLLGFNARHRLLLTGTPLQNNLMELWSLLYFLMPAGLNADGKGPFADSADFQAWFSNPMDKAIENGEALDEETKATVAKLHTVLRPYLLRRLKSEVEKQMPGKTESIIYCRLSKRQRFLYDDFMSRSQTKETLGSGHFLSIINCLMQLRKVCNHPDLFEVRPIVTSFAMTKSVASEYEVKELLVRKRLLAEAPIGQMDWTSLTLIKPTLELTTSLTSLAHHLDPATLWSTLVEPLAPEPPRDVKSIAGWKRHQTWQHSREQHSRLSSLARINTQRCTDSTPYFGAELLHLLLAPQRQSRAALLLPPEVVRDSRTLLSASTHLPHMVKSYSARAEQLDEVVAKFGFVTPKVKAADMPRHALAGVTLPQLHEMDAVAPVEILQRASTRLSVAFPDRSLLQYDCGKLQKLDELLRECKAGGHRVLIFTQMTKVLDILEVFLSFHGHRYLRLDGSTKIEQRQIITERFNSNDKILCFISSTRSGGLGINLQGADTVIFYDSDWNPALDRQCQDRAHRIGQTREVRIWRFVTEHSIEENMLKKANQKRRLDEMVIAEGDFTTDYLQKLDWRDYLDEGQLKELGVDGEPLAPGATGRATGAGAESAAEIRQALAAAEDEEDAVAAKAAEGELHMDETEFSETAALDAAAAVIVEEDPLAGTVDGYMMRFVESYLGQFD